MTEQLFFELIRVSIGTQVTLSKPPSAVEWKELYAMAKKQSLVGICFAGLQKLYNFDNQEPSTNKPQPDSTKNQEPITHNLDEVQYLTWMGMAAKIQQRNEVVNKQCVDLQKRLAAEGLNSVVMKGQGVAQYHPEHLRGLRQSGDIDILVDGGFEKVIKVAQNIAPVGKCSYVHADWKVYDDTEVELHYRPSTLRNLIKNRCLHKWAKTFTEETYKTRGGIVVPSAEFNRVYLLLHCYRHVIGAGIGLRQLMDYYFCLSGNIATEEEQKRTTEILNKLGLMKFAGAVMYLLVVVFGLDESNMVCHPNKDEGEYLLKQTLIGGNFGRHDVRVKKKGNGVMRKLFMNMRYALHYPDELIWAVPFRIYMWIWETKHKPKQR